MEIRYHFIRDYVNEEKIKISHCPTTRMLADMLTKALPGPALTQQRARIMSDIKVSPDQSWSDKLQPTTQVEGCHIDLKSWNEVLDLWSWFRLKRDGYDWNTSIYLEIYSGAYGATIWYFDWKKTSGFKTKLASARFVPPLVNETLVLTIQ